MTNFDPLWGDTAAWQVSAAPALRIGAVDGDEPYLFAAVEALIRLPDGRIVMMDETTRELRAFSPDGLHLWTRGGHGAGPGEFSSGRPRHFLEHLEGDVVQVASAAKRVRFTADGQLLDDTRIDWPRLHRIGNVAPCDDILSPIIGNDYLLFENCPGSATMVGLRRRGAQMVHLPWSLERMDTLGWFHAYESWVTSWQRGSFFDMRLPLSMLWSLTSGEWKWMFAVGGEPPRLAYARFDRYRIFVYDLSDHALALIVERPGAMYPPTALELDSALTRFDRWVDAVGRANTASGLDMSGYRADMAEARKVMPDSISPMDRVLIDKRSHVWVAHRVERDVAVRTWTVFRDDGILLGEIALPAGLTVHEIGADYILGVTHDELRVPFITMLALDRGT